MTELSAIHQDVGALQASVKHLSDEQDHSRERDEKIFKLLDDIKNSQSISALQLVGFSEKMDDVKTRLKAVEDGVADYRSVKRAGMMIWAGSVGVAGLIGWFVQYLGDLWHGRT